MVEKSKIAEEDKNIEQVVKVMRNFVNNEEILDIYDKINDVKYYAREEEKKEIAKKMLQNGYDINQIVKYTGLSINVIKELN